MERTNATCMLALKIGYIKHASTLDLMMYSTRCGMRFSLQNGMSPIRIYHPSVYLPNTLSWWGVSSPVAVPRAQVEGVEAGGGGGCCCWTHGSPLEDSLCGQFPIQFVNKRHVCTTSGTLTALSDMLQVPDDCSSPWAAGAGMSSRGIPVDHKSNRIYPWYYRITLHYTAHTTIADARIQLYAYTRTKAYSEYI